MLNAKVMTKNASLNSTQTFTFAATGFPLPCGSYGHDSGLARFARPPVRSFAVAASSAAHDSTGRKRVTGVCVISEKSEKWVFAVFRLEPAAVQSIATETDRRISRISREILRGWYMGEGGEEMLKERKNHEN